MAEIECLQGAIRGLIAERQALREHDGGREDLEANRLELGSRHRQLSHALIDRYLCRPAMSRAGIQRVGPTLENRTFHSFRHTFAKRALESGAQITWLSRHLGL